MNGPGFAGPAFCFLHGWWTPTLKRMSALHRTAASLRFFGDDLDPDEITTLLGARPTVGVRKGGFWKTSMGAEKVAGTGSWRLETERRAPSDLDAHITELFQALTTDLTIWKSLSARFRADVFCGLFMEESNEGISLNPDTLLALGVRGLVLDLDIYGPEAA